MSNNQRKTVKVEDLVKEANRFLHFSANTPEERDSDNMKGMRRGIMMYLEHFLMETGNYAGFRYIQCEDGKQTEDDTLRQYYLKS